MPDPKAERDHLQQSSKEFDHPNHARMDRHFLPTVNNELVMLGYIPSKEIPIVKHQIRELAFLARINAGNDKSAATCWEIESMTWTAERLLEHARDGFDVRMGNTYIEEQSLRINGQGGKGKRGWNPFNRKKDGDSSQPQINLNLER